MGNNNTRARREAAAAAADQDVARSVHEEGEEAGRDALSSLPAPSGPLAHMSSATEPMAHDDDGTSDRGDLAAAEEDEEEEEDEQVEYADTDDDEEDAFNTNTIVIDLDDFFVEPAEDADIVPEGQVYHVGGPSRRTRRAGAYGDSDDGVSDGGSAVIDDDHHDDHNDDHDDDHDDDEIGRAETVEVDQAVSGDRVSEVTAAQLAEFHRLQERMAWNAFKTRTSVTPADILKEDVDQQGIPWQAIRKSRAGHHSERLANAWDPALHGGRRQHEAKAMSNLAPDLSYDDFAFQYSGLKAEASSDHFQLRHLAVANTSHDIYYAGHFELLHWSARRHCKEVALDLSGRGDSRTLMMITTVAAGHNLVAVGGFDGELVCVDVTKAGDNAVVYAGKLTTEDSAITNGLEFTESRSGAPVLLAANNDSMARILDINHFQPIASFALPWPVNYARLSPDRRLVCAVGDGPEGYLLDARTGLESLVLLGHTGNSFSCSWMNDGLHVATANEDSTTRIFDIRNPDRAVHIIASTMEVPRSVQYSPDNRFLVIGESTDMVSILDVAADYAIGQQIALFGTIGGVTFTPDSEGLYVVNSDHVFNTLLEYRRIGPHCGADDLHV